MLAARPFPTYVINLARDEARRRHMVALLDRIGLAGTFMTAVDGRELRATDRAMHEPLLSLRLYGKPMLDAELGCYLSHYRLWQRIVQYDVPAALILEDDVDIDANLPGLVEDLLARPEWMVVRLHSMRAPVLQPRNASWRGLEVVGLRDGAGLFRLRTHVLGAAAYLIRADGARRLLEYGRRIVLPVDQTMDRFWENGLVPYVVRPFPVRQRAEFASSIGARLPGPYRELPVSLALSRRMQRAGDGLRKRLHLLAS